MAKLRHLALYTADPEKTAAFYCKAFDMKEVGRTKSSVAEGVFISDGTLNVACLRYKSPEIAAEYGSSATFGMSHFGFWVEDIEGTREQLRELGAHFIDTRDPAAAPMGFFEEKWKGPDGTTIDITDQGWVGAEPPKAR